MMRNMTIKWNFDYVLCYCYLGIPLVRNYCPNFKICIPKKCKVYLTFRLNTIVISKTKKTILIYHEDINVV